MDEEILLNSVTLLPPAKIARAWRERCNLRAAPERHSAELQRHRWARSGPSRGGEDERNASEKNANRSVTAAATLPYGV